VPADVFALLADPTRRRVVEVLHEGELSVSDIVARVAIAQPGVSRHLRLLEEGGFVRCRAEGQRRLYALRPEPFRELEAWMRRYAHEEVARLERLADLVDGPGHRHPRGGTRRARRPAARRGHRRNRKGNA
jgi:DNA-binding transcriptional ArsR family regulator